jgi:threonine/homoserine/homoserine lactone efflux protein
MFALSLAGFLAIGPFVLIPFVVLAGWLVYEERRGRYVRPHDQSRWQRWVLGGVAFLVAWPPFPFWLVDIPEWLWVVLMALSVSTILAVVVGVGIGLRDRRNRRPAKPA